MEELRRICSPEALFMRLLANLMMTEKKRSEFEVESKMPHANMEYQNPKTPCFGVLFVF